MSVERLAHHVADKIKGSDNYFGSNRRCTEDFAIYLADPDRVIGCLFSRRENASLVCFLATCYLASSVYAYISGWFAPGLTISEEIWSTALYLVSASISALSTAFAADLGWYLKMGNLARRIREDCMCSNVEKGYTSKERLAEFIEELLSTCEDGKVDWEEKGKIIRASIRDDGEEARRWGWHKGWFPRRRAGIVLV